MDSILERIYKVHSDCTQLIYETFGTNFNVSGNVGIFAQSDEEFRNYKDIARLMTNPSTNPDQKYFKLIEPISIDEQEFTHLYIRKYDPSDYGKNLGDIDFVTSKTEYLLIKDKVANGKYKNASIYNRPGWDTIQIQRDDVKSVAYLSTIEMAEKLRVKFDNLTKL